MKNLGISVVGRSFLLKKNYRNTKEITNVATLLAVSEGVGKFDDDPVAAQTVAIPSTQSGDRPLLMIAPNPDIESKNIAKEIKYLINKAGLGLHEICCIARSKWERTSVKAALKAVGIPSVDYKADGITVSDSIKVSNLHNSKGHEFRAVFISGLFDGAVPLLNAIESEDLEKEAALLYVAITRAKELLYLSHPQVDQNQRKLEPSRFINCLLPGLEIINL
jgi:superfamily I DNA/RNA helicase